MSREVWEQPTAIGSMLRRFIWLLIRTIPSYLRDRNLPSPLCLLFPLQVREFSQLSCMLPWVYMMIGFTLRHKVHVSMPIHVTEWQYTRPHLMMSFGFWGLLPSCIWGLVDGYTSLWCAVCRAVMLGCIDLLPRQYWVWGYTCYYGFDGEPLPLMVMSIVALRSHL